MHGSAVIWLSGRLSTCSVPSHTHLRKVAQRTQIKATPYNPVAGCPFYIAGWITSAVLRVHVPAGESPYCLEDVLWTLGQVGSTQYHRCMDDWYLIHRIEQRSKQIEMIGTSMHRNWMHHVHCHGRSSQQHHPLLPPWSKFPICQSECPGAWAWSMRILSEKSRNKGKREER